MSDIWSTIADERRRAADDFEHLTEEQLAQPSQCEGWTVREACAHLILPFGLSTPQFLLGILTNFGNVNAFVKKKSVGLAAKNSHAEVIAQLRSNADNKWTPPGKKFGAEVPLSEIVVHGQDIRNALGMACTIPDDVIELTLTGISNEKVRADYAKRISG